MRIAVLSDIHGNLPALEAVMRDLERYSPDEVWCGGDIAWGGPWGKECIQIVRNQGWTTVKGNADVWITGDPQTVEDPDQREMFEKVAVAHDIDADDAAWLLNLPLGHTGPGSILLIHASPDSAFTAPLPDAEPREFLVYQEQATLVIYAHVHQAFTRRLFDGTLVCNTGSVGLPLDHIAGSYLLIDQYGNDVSLRHRRVRFDRDVVRKRVEEVGEPLQQLFLRFFDAFES